jgi:HSP20 family protein
MTLVPYIRRHRNGLSRLHSDMDDLFNAFFGGLDMPRYEQKVWPALDIAENEDSIVVHAELPGCKTEDINISVHGNTLTISGEKKESVEKEEKGYYHVERSYGSFRRDLNLPSDIDADKIDAVFKDGILTLTLPKAEKAKPIKVKVKSQ